MLDEACVTLWSCSSIQVILLIDESGIMVLHVSSLFVPTCSGTATRLFLEVTSWIIFLQEGGCERFLQGVEALL